MKGRGANDRLQEARVAAMAPGTVANLGPGFDVLGLAVEGMGDIVIAERSTRLGVRLVAIEGDEGRLPTDSEANTAGIAAASVLRRSGISLGVDLTLKKGLPLCSGLGSSASSAVAAAFAVNRLLGNPLRKSELIGPCLEAEEQVSGRHADNIAPALLGGLVLVRSVDPPDLVRLPLPVGLTMVLVTPEFELPTRKARAVLPDSVPLTTMVSQSAQIAALVSACYSEDLSLLSRCLVDPVVTPVRAPLIPGADAAMEAALGAGALGSSISGAGPSLFALCRSPRSAQAAARVMVAAFQDAGLEAHTHLSKVDCPGVRIVDPATPVASQ
ncbi:MAG TPA: homoserine kinase [Deltaproteobacteria bacterium]|nr:homoserine kinase [Deltaproteobacteria bacterium]HCP48017.1 homoserine kinase [Deltaproteobacteria bacterium]